jgi:hypothetical protein
VEFKFSNIDYKFIETEDAEDKFDFDRDKIEG